MADIPFHDRDGYIWMDGEFVDWRDAKVHVLTHALHYGSAVFEGDRAYDGEIFALEDHSQRLIDSAKAMDFTIPYSRDEIDRACRETLAKSGLGSAYVRPFAWRGSEKMGVSAKGNTIHMSVAIWEWGSYFEDKMKGIRLTMAKWKRPAPDTIPCKAKGAGLYMICTMSKHAAEAEALMMHLCSITVAASQSVQARIFSLSKTESCTRQLMIFFWMALPIKP